ncbi:MAG: DUF2207 domain-containing protein [Bacilli bacterium]|nr:DUF2207 domain-containing protein [Bacilli bacterium]
MKKIKYIGLFLLLLLFSLKVSAANSVSKISMDIYVDTEGNAHVTEIWDAKLSKGTEGYHPFYNIGNSMFTNFSVKDDTNRTYTSKSYWNTSDSFEEKAYTNGIHSISNGVELCWGISQYGKRTYTLTYTITNFIYNTTDNYQILFWQLIPYDMDPKPDDVYIKIHADERFSDQLDVWGYGNKGGTAYVYDGYIEMGPPKNGLKSSDYMTVLVKFPENYFNTTNKINKSWDEVFNGAEDGADKYDVKKEEFWDKFFSTIFIIFEILLFVGIPIIIAMFAKNGTNKIKNKVYPKKDVLPFRDLPFKDNFSRAYFISSEYSLYNKKEDYLGAVILKWIKNDNVSVTTEEKGIFKTKTTKIELKKQPEDQIETQLYLMMVEAAKDDILENNEFKKYCQRHYSKILSWFDKVISDENSKLRLESEYINKVMTKTMFGQKEVEGATDKLNEKAAQMAGLKKFFKEFTSMHDKQAIEVKMWRDYLIYAQIFGMAKEVAKEFKNLYPDVITDNDYNDIILIHSFSSDSVSAASAARSRAESYSAGGGGFSSGGGGGGSFGGGGGGGGFR